MDRNRPGGLARVYPGDPCDDRRSRGGRGGLRRQRRHGGEGLRRLHGLRSSHPIEVPVKKADEINQMYLSQKELLTKVSMLFHTRKDRV